MQNQLCHQMSTKRINDASNIFPRANIKQLSVRTRVWKEKKLKHDCVNDLLHNAPPTPKSKTEPKP